MFNYGEIKEKVLRGEHVNDGEFRELLQASVNADNQQDNEDFKAIIRRRIVLNSLERTKKKAKEEYERASAEKNRIVAEYYQRQSEKAEDKANELMLEVEELQEKIDADQETLSKLEEDLRKREEDKAKLYSELSFLKFFEEAPAEFVSAIKQLLKRKVKNQGIAKMLIEENETSSTVVIYYKVGEKMSRIKFIYTNWKDSYEEGKKLRAILQTNLTVAEPENIMVPGFEWVKENFLGEFSF